MTVCMKSETELLDALVSRTDLDDVVPEVLDLLDHDPLASAGLFPGDLLRAMIDLPSVYWSRRARLFARYQSAVRAGAVARRALPVSDQMSFWTDAGRWRTTARSSFANAVPKSHVEEEA